MKMKMNLGHYADSSNSGITFNKLKAQFQPSCKDKRRMISMLSFYKCSVVYWRQATAVGVIFGHLTTSFTLSSSFSPAQL